MTWKASLGLLVVVIVGCHGMRLPWAAPEPVPDQRVVPTINPGSPLWVDGPRLKAISTAAEHFIGLQKGLLGESMRKHPADSGVDLEQDHALQVNRCLSELAGYDVRAVADADRFIIYFRPSSDRCARPGGRITDGDGTYEVSGVDSSIICHNIGLGGALEDPSCGRRPRSELSDGGTRDPAMP
jgi:hypothetical protein